jgi:hypothetical protein
MVCKLIELAKGWLWKSIQGHRFEFGNFSQAAIAYPNPSEQS